MNPSPPSTATRRTTRTVLDTSKLTAAIAEVQDTAGRMSQGKTAANEPTTSKPAANETANSKPTNNKHDSLETELREQMEAVVFEIRFLLRTSLYQWFAAMRNARHLSVRNILRHAANRSIMTLGECERWLRYCDLLGFKSSLCLIPLDSDSLPKLNASEVQDFIEDANRLAKQLGQKIAEDPVYRFGSYE